MVFLWAKWACMILKSYQNETKNSLLTWASDFCPDFWCKASFSSKLRVKPSLHPQRGKPMDDKIIAIFCLGDDLLKAMHHQENLKVR
jgi:hypothetical protein